MLVVSFDSSAIGDTKVSFCKAAPEIFVCPFADLFGEWVDRLWIQAVIDVVRENHIHQFAFLTKNPQRYHEFQFPKNVYLGATIESPDKMFRADAMKGLTNKLLASIGRKKTKADRENMRSIAHRNKYQIYR